MRNIWPTESGVSHAARHRETLAGQERCTKAQLTEAIVRDVTSILHYGDESVSVALEEVAPDDWTEQVYKPDILGKWERLKATRLRSATLTVAPWPTTWMRWLP